MTVKNPDPASNYTVKQLPSGYWSVWRCGEWIEASLPSREAAENYIRSVTGSKKPN